jgi:hypothetical protein
MISKRLRQARDDARSRPWLLDARRAAGCQGLRPGAVGQTTVVVELGAVATAALRAVQDAILHEPHRALTVGELDDAGLIRLRGDVSTQSSCVELTDAGERALDGID